MYPDSHTPMIQTNLAFSYSRIHTHPEFTDTQDRHSPGINRLLDFTDTETNTLTKIHRHPEITLTQDSQISGFILTQISLTPCIQKHPWLILTQDSHALGFTHSGITDTWDSHASILTLTLIRTHLEFTFTQDSDSPNIYRQSGFTYSGFTQGIHRYQIYINPYSRSSRIYRHLGFTLTHQDSQNPGFIFNPGFRHLGITCTWDPHSLIWDSQTTNSNASKIHLHLGFTCNQMTNSWIHIHQDSR